MVVVTNLEGVSEGLYPQGAEVTVALAPRELSPVAVRLW
jgi:hypothetical protein